MNFENEVLGNMNITDEGTAKQYCKLGYVI